MSRDIHAHVRELIALTGFQDLSSEVQARLQSHLRDCANCREYEAEAGALIRALRAEPLIADAWLVQAAQRRARSWIVESQARQERFWLVSLSCLLVGLSAAITTPLLGQLFRMVGGLTAAPHWVWESGFLFASFFPALLASAVLLARGSHFTGGITKISEGR